MSNTATAGKIDCPWLSTGELGRRYGVHRDTVWDWIIHGVKAVGGSRIKLRALRIGGQWKTTEQWAREFFIACQGGEDPAPVAEPAGQREARAKALKEKARQALGG